MNLIGLKTFCRVADRHDLVAVDITIKGKDSMTISFTAARSDYSLIAEMCEESEWTFHTSMDTFIARDTDRYQIHLDGREV